MPAPSLASSSMKSKDASTASRQSAQAAAQKAFAAEPPLPFDADSSKVVPALGGKSRLRGAFEISIDLLERDPEQPRTTFDASKLSELANSIASRGFQQILRAYPKTQWHAISGPEWLPNKKVLTGRKFHVVAVGSIGHWIENFYNTERLHSALDYSSPVEYEEIHKCSLANFK